MPDLVLQLTRRTDGAVIFRCVRNDGSATWQRHDGPTARFFPAHDLTHLAVETALGHRRGFYAMVADGWDLTDFGAPWPRGPLPPDLSPSELIVGFLDRERASGVEWSAAEFDDGAARYHAEHRLAGPPPTLTDDELRRCRRERDALLARWLAVPPGGTLELTYSRPATPAGASPHPRR
jgi:hypothetical protein